MEHPQEERPRMEHPQDQRPRMEHPQEQGPRMEHPQEQRPRMEQPQDQQFSTHGFALNDVGGFAQTMPGTHAKLSAAAVGP